MIENRLIQRRLVSKGDVLHRKFAREIRRWRGEEAARKAAFTLVEVVLSLGIISSGAVVLMGMLPVALSFARQTMDLTIEAQIAQKMTSEALQTDYSNLPNLATTGTSYFCFDDQGDQTTQSSVVYEAGFVISTTTALPASVSTNKLATVSICILNTKAGQIGTEPDPTKNPNSKKFTVLIPDNGL